MPFSFCKVEISLQSSFQPGMKLEVANKSNPDTYWVATIITTCGQLLLLRYCGYGDDRRADFWCDVMTADLHPVGWCTQNSKVLMPPDGEFCMFCEGHALVLGWWLISRLQLIWNGYSVILKWCWVTQSGSDPHGSMGDSVSQSASSKGIFTLVGNNRRRFYRKLS